MSHYRICVNKITYCFVKPLLPVFPLTIPYGLTNRSITPFPKSVFKHSPVSRQCPCNGYLKFFNLADSLCFATIITMCQPLTPPALQPSPIIHSSTRHFNAVSSTFLFQNLHLKPFVVGLLRHRTFKNSFLLIIEIYKIRFSRQLIER